MSPEHKNKNRLALIRKKKGLEQKQIATLLGYKTTDAVSRIERGAQIPSFETALKLGIIYGLPIQILFYGCYELCENEIERSKKNLSLLEKSAGLNGKDTKIYTEFCTFEELMKSQRVIEPDLNKVRHHVTELLRIRSEKMDYSATKAQ